MGNDTNMDVQAKWSIKFTTGLLPMSNWELISKTSLYSCECVEKAAELVAIAQLGYDRNFVIIEGKKHDCHISHCTTQHLVLSPINAHLKQYYEDP